MNFMININLLLTSDSEKSHYTWIKDFGQIVYKNSKHKGKNYACYKYLQSHSVKSKFESHMKECKGIRANAQPIEMPEGGKNILKFVNHQKQIRVPYL